MIQLTRRFSPSSIATPTLVRLLSAFAPLVHAEDETLEAIETPTASVLASSEYANKRCPNLESDESELQDLLTRINKTKDDLRSHESYEEQRTDGVQGAEWRAWGLRPRRDQREVSRCRPDLALR